MQAALFVADLAAADAEQQLTPWDMVAMHPDWTADSRIVVDTYDIMIFQGATGAANLLIVDADRQIIALTEFPGRWNASVAAEGDTRRFERDLHPN